MIPVAFRRWLGAFTFLICLCSVAPVLVIIVESFTSTNYVVFPPPGFSIKWYAEIAKRPEFLSSLGVSAIVATCASVISTAIGMMASMALARNKSWRCRLLQSFFMMPMSLPGLIFGLAMLRFFSLQAIPINMVSLVIAHVVITTPFAIRFTSVALLNVHPSVQLAARSLGANRWHTFRYMTLPLARSGIVASLVFAFILSFDEVAASLFLSSPDAMTLPVRIYTYIDANYDPLITAISSILAFAAIIALVVIERLVGIGRLFGLRA